MTRKSQRAPQIQRGRTCVGCRRRAVRDELVRLVLRRDSAAVIWPPELALELESLDGRERGARRMHGRGVYLHRSVPCIRRAAEIGVLERAFRLPRGGLARLSVDSVVESLLAQVTSDIREGPPEKGKAGAAGGKVEAPLAKRVRL